MRPRQTCEKCGNAVEPEISTYRRKRHLPGMLCKKCHAEDVAARRQQRQDKSSRRKEELRRLFDARCCVVCGGHIQWKYLYFLKTPERWPVTCSAKCHAIWAVRKNVLTKEQVEARLEAYIRSQGRQMSYKEVIEGTHIASKVLSKFHISILDIMKRIFGLQIDREQAHIETDVKTESLLELCARLNRQADTYAELAHKVLADFRTVGFDQTKASLSDIAMSYIQSRGCYTGVTVLMHDLGLSFDTLREHYKLDIADMNRQLGYRDTKSSWFEHTAYLELVEMFGVDEVSREHTFSDCLSAKNFPLRFDFYIPSIRLLVEIDGTQHMDKTNPYYKPETRNNDAIKDAYATNNGYMLIRVPTMPRFTFKERLNDSLLGVLKRIELLETQTGGAVGNQQPRPDVVTYLF